MNRLISGFCFSLIVISNAALGQVGYTFPSDPPPVRPQQPGQPGLPANLPPGASALDYARAYSSEGSWQLLLQIADQATTRGLNPDQLREFSYLHARAHTELGQYDEALTLFQSMITENNTDAWAARAHIMLQPGLSPVNRDHSNENPFHHLRQADQILTTVKPDDLKDIYQRIIDSPLTTRPYNEESDREFILSFFDKIEPLMQGDNEALAQTLLRRERALDAQAPSPRTSEERLAGWRNIVSKFPQTDAAAQAQWLVAQHYISRQDYTLALTELEILTSRFSGTDRADQAAKEIQKIRQPEALFSLSGQFLPGEPVRFDLATRNADSVQILARPFNFIDEIKRQKVTRLDLNDVKANAFHTETITVERGENHGTTTRPVELKIDRPGTYVLTAQVDGRPLCHQLLIVSNLALVGNTGPRSVEMWVVDANTGRPRPGVDITIGHNIQNEQRWFSGRSVTYFSEYSTVKTDESGFADFTPADDNRGRQMVAIAIDGDHVALLDDMYWNDFLARRDPDYITSYIYTDRPVYRPAQKVYWRALLRTSANGQFQMPPAGPYRIKVIDTQGQEIWSENNIRLSEFGTLDGQFTLPEGAALGRYLFEIRSDRRNVSISGGNFRVEEYKKPEYLVTVESASDFARVGDTIKAEVSATYLFGAPVTEGTVQYTVRRRPKMFPLWRHLSWNLDDRDLGWFDATEERPSVLHGSHGTIVAEGTGRLDNEGKFILEFDSQVSDAELEYVNPGPITPYSRSGMASPSRGLVIWPPLGPPGWDFQIEVTVTDASRRNIDASQIIPVGLKALSLAARTNRQLVSPGDIARVELKSHNLAMKPVSTSGTLYVEKLEWDADAKEDRVTTVSTQAVEIDTSGSLLVNWRVPGDLHGRLRFAYIVDDPFGGKSVAYAPFTAVTPDVTELPMQYHGVEIVADRSIYEVGDTARIMILNEYKDTTAWYWIDAGTDTLDKKILPLPHRTNFITIPITEAHVPNSKIHIVAVREKRVITDEFELIVPPTRRVLNVTVQPDSDTVEPGQTGSVTIRATDHTGAPVSAEFSLSIFDKAITYIAPDMREDIRRFFYGMRRPLYSSLSQSLDSAGRYGRFLIDDSLISLPPDDSHPPIYPASVLTRGEAPQRARMSTVPPPLSFAAPAQEMSMADSTGEFKAAGEPELEMPDIRTDFRDSMFWAPTIRTNAEGSATVEIKYPDSLTTWQMDAIGLTPDTRVGNATTETIARKKVLVRLQTPRFFRERDELTISGNIHNYTENTISVNTLLQTSGVFLEGGTTSTATSATGTMLENSRTVTVPSNGETRIDWKVRVNSAQAGNAILNLIARSQAGSDAMQTTVPLLPHGIDKFVAWNGTSEDADTTDSQTRISGTGKVITRTITLPAERIRETTRLEINVNPSLAYSIRGALPYMIDFPYGCVEQTMSRFMPAMVAASAFEKLGIPADKTLQDKLPQVTDQSMKLLRDMQLPTGGWGWWASDYENAEMTAYVVYGLTLAKQSGADVDEPMFRSGLARLAQLRDDLTSSVQQHHDRQAIRYYVPGTGGLHQMIYAEYVLTLNGQTSPETVDLAWEKRDQLSARGLAMLARTLGMTGRRSDADVVLRNMMNVAVITSENNTLRWGKPESGYLWYNDAVEATAVGLMAFLELHPDDPAVDQAMKWLVLNRQGNQWKSTRDTSHAVLALTQYMLHKKESAANATIRVSVDGKQVSQLTVNPASFWDFDGKIELRGTDLPDGEFPVQIEVESNSKIYYSIFAEYFTQEEGIAPAGNEIYVTRVYERLRREQTTETVRGQDADIYKDTWEPLKDGDVLQSGDEVRVTLNIKSLNDYEYLVFEDPKAAGLEPVDLQSGNRYGGISSNMELRDAWTAFFITRLRQGEHQLTYRMRAEIPGVFHTMPTTGYGMYFPILRANSGEHLLEVRD